MAEGPTTDTTETRTPTAYRPERIRIELIMEAWTPIAHAKGNDGNRSHVMTSGFMGEHGLEQVPILTANALRHQLRAAGSLAVLEAAGIDDGLSKEALRLLFNGGHLEGGSDGGAIQFDKWREMIEVFPPLRLFGGCTNNRIVEGSIVVGSAKLIAWETARFIPQWAREAATYRCAHTDEFTGACRAVRWPATPIAVDAETGGETYAPCRDCGDANKPRREALHLAYDHVDDMQSIRMEPLLAPRNQALLTSDARVEVNAMITSAERASANNDAVSAKQNKLAPMPHVREIVVPGSLFFWDVETIVTSEIDRDTFLVCLGDYLADPRIGGNQGRGSGQLRCVAANRILMSSPSRAHETLDTSAITSRRNVGDLFRRHVEERRDRVRDFISKVVA